MLSLSAPTAYGAAEPARLLRELPAARPDAAAAPANVPAGSSQNGEMVEYTPAATTHIASSATTGLTDRVNAETTRKTPATAMGSAVCSTRSPRRSESRLQSHTATVATAYRTSTADAHRATHLRCNFRGIFMWSLGTSPRARSWEGVIRHPRSTAAVGPASPHRGPTAVRRDERVLSAGALDQPVAEPQSFGGGAEVGER